MILFEFTLEGGDTVTIREIGPDDGDLLKLGFGDRALCAP